MRLGGSSGLKAAIIAAAVAACGPNAGSSGGDAGTTIVEAVSSLPTSYAYDAGDFTYAGEEFKINTNAQLLRNPYVKTASGVLEQDFFHFEGALAESYEVSPDGLTYIFHLRKGVLSQAGHELTTDDVLYSYDRKWHSASAARFISYPAIIDPAKQFTKLGKYDLAITVDQAGEGMTLLSLLAHISGDIFDSTLLKEHATAEDPYAVRWSALHGNYGFGAYRLDSFTPGQQLVLTANPNYYAGSPAVKKVIQQLVPDAGTRANLVRNKDVDIATALLPADIASFGTAAATKTFIVDTIQFTTLELNTVEGQFTNGALRQAMRYALPYDAIIQQVYRGRAVGQKGFLNPRYPGATDAGLEANRYDPEKAKQILTDAGFKLPVTVTMSLANGYPDLQEVAVQIQSAAMAAGITVNLKVLPMAGADQAYYTRNFESFLTKQGAITQSPAYELMLEFTKDSPLNTTGWASADYAAAVAKGVAAGDPLTPEAGKWWNEAQKIWQHSAPTLPICFIQPSIAFGPRVQGYAYRSDGIIDFANLSLTPPGGS
jgi:peptide/nickel transport system substrate-binding protein